MKKTIGIMLSLLLCAALILPACAESAVTITLSQSALEIGTGGKIKLEVNTESTEKLKYTWETSDKKIASVDGKGTVSGVAEGEATVTCSAVLGKDVVAAAECKVTVYTSIKTVKAASPIKGNLLFVNKPIQIETTIAPENATYQKLVWTSSDESIATVDENGVATGHLPGKVSITCESNQPNQQKAISASIQFTVKQPVDEIVLDATMVVLWEKDSLPDLPNTAEVNAQALPENADNLKLDWSTSDKNIAEVKNGTITAKKAGGCVLTVAAADGGGTASSMDIIVLSPFTYKISADGTDSVDFAFTADAGKATEIAGKILRAAMERLNEIDNPSRFIMLKHFAKAAEANAQVFLTGTADDASCPVTLVMTDDQGNIALLSYDPVWGSFYFSVARSFSSDYAQVPVDGASFGAAIPEWVVKTEE